MHKRINQRDSLFLLFLIDIVHGVHIFFPFYPHLIIYQHYTLHILTLVHTNTHTHTQVLIAFTAKQKKTHRTQMHKQGKEEMTSNTLTIREPKSTSQ